MLSASLNNCVVTVQDRNKKKVGEGVRPESVAGGGWFEVLWNLECPVGLNQKRNMCAFH